MAALGAQIVDSGWYLARYPDVAASEMNALRHYVQYGLQEGRDGSPRLSLSGYQWRYGTPDWTPQRALANYWLKGRWLGRQGIVEVAGARSEVRRRCMLVCAHSVSPTLAGAERSLLDVVAGLDSLGFDVVVVVPNARHSDYLQALLGLTRSVVIMPYGWWRSDRPVSPVTRELIAELMQRHAVEALYVNTVTLEDAPMAAAHLLGKPVIMHVRELPAHDPELCQVLNATAAQVLARVGSLADRLVANSRHTARVFDPSGRIAKVVPNTLDVADYAALPAPKPGERLQVGLVGSLVAKKGLADIERLAMLLEQQGQAIDFQLFGAESSELKSLLARQAAGSGPSNLHYQGYVESPLQALAKLDVVLNLSSMQESFGRSVLEAMACARPVVCYDWGALSELVEEGRNGYLVPLGDVNAVAERLMRLASQPERLAEMGGHGRRMVEKRYGQAAFHRALRHAVADLAALTDPEFGPESDTRRN